MKNPGPPIRPKHIIEYAALRGLAALLNVLPHRGALLAGWVIAALAFHVFRFRVAEALRRIHGVFGERFSDRERRRIAWQSWRNTVFNAVELLRIPRLTPARLAQRADYSACLNAIKRHTDTGQGAVIAVPHMGNWELAGIGCLFAGIPIFNIAARQRNPLVNAFFNRLRSSPGIETLERGTDTMRTVIRNLKSGMALAILPDARMNEGGMALPFLGGQANLGTGMALFARHAGVPIFPCVVIRIGWTRHQAHGFPPLWPDRTLDKKADIERLTAAVVQLMDKVIQEHPEQWFWFNKRWVLDP